MKSRIISIVGLVLFAVCALFWADCYTYMKSAHDVGEEFAIQDYAKSLGNRLAGRQDAAAMRRERRAIEAAKAAPAVAFSVEKLNGVAPTMPEFKSVDSAKPESGQATTGAMATGSGGIRFIGVANASGCAMVGSVKRCRVGG
ncbi:hypothetical protein [Pseudooceanicola sp.]|uniref:hypothetical protein n=1 Tax=Pseudooceanicola sp. TaxID=1914328 RepID=UPI002637EE3F|nr:hypothetical protein [Pseudooceanicola sp.]MDF1854303.1 hypothetical protein [Pseudooceanicola sp.]